MDYTQELEILKKELFDVNMRLNTVNNDEEKNKLLKLKEEIKQSMAKIMIAKELNRAHATILRKIDRNKFYSKAKIYKYL